MKKVKNRLKRYISAVLVTAFLALAVLTLPAFAVDDDEALNFLPMFDSLTEKSMTLTQVAEVLGNKTCTDGESEYLKSVFGDQKLKYGSDFDANIKVESTGSMVTVTAQPYTYKAENGADVVWTPVKATGGNVTVDLAKDESGDYTGVIRNVSVGNDFYVVVQYDTTFSISQEIANEIVNGAYNEGASSRSKIVVYENEKSNYDRAKRQYDEYRDEYRKYESDIEYYAEYTLKYSTWSVKKAEYDAYMVLKNAYDHNEELKATYEDRLKAYEAVLEVKNACLAKLNTFSSVFDYRESIQTSLGEMITGTGLTIVYEKLNAVKENSILNTMYNSFFGAIAGDFSNAESSTRILADMLNEYKELTTERERFEWFKTNYSVLLVNYNLLYKSMSIISSNSKFSFVLSVAGMADKETRIRNFVAELGSYVDKIENPEETPWPDGAEPPEEPDPNITEPEPVENPGYMAPMTAPVAPEPVDNPGDPPEQLTLTPLQKKLADEYQSGKIKSSEVKNTINVSTTVIAKISSIGAANIITFYDSDGTVIVRKEYTGPNMFSTVVPNTPSDNMYIYEFVGWQTAQGQTDFSNVSQDLNIYPYFNRTLRRYTVTWVTAKGTTSEIYDFGSTPEFKGDTSKAADQFGEYVFVGWNTAIGPVTGDITYTAQYQYSADTFTVTWKIGSRSFTTNVVSGQIPQCPKDPQGIIDQEFGISQDKYYVFAGWDKEPSTCLSDCEYVAKTETKWVVPLYKEGSEFGASVEKKESAWNVAIQGKDFDVDLTHLISLANKDESAVVATFGKDIVTLPANIVKELSLDSSVQLFFAHTNTEGAIDVTFYIKSADGTRKTVQGITVFVELGSQGKTYVCEKLASDGTYTECQMEVSGSVASFTLDGQSQSYRIREISEEKTYTIKFYADGKLISTLSCKAGEKITAPVVTKDKADGREYTFEKWAPDFAEIVTADASYMAIFNEKYVGGPSALVIILIIVIILAVLLLLFFIAKKYNIFKSFKKEVMDTEEAEDKVPESEEQQEIEELQKPDTSSKFEDSETESRADLGETLSFTISTEIPTSAFDDEPEQQPEPERYPEPETKEKQIKPEKADNDSAPVKEKTQKPEKEKQQNPVAKVFKTIANTLFVRPVKAVKRLFTRMKNDVM